MRYRYPGPKPFTENDEELFFGRNEEKEVLNGIVYNNKLTVLFGRSGYGKSSLIQAGVVPVFKDEHKYKIIEIRFSYSSAKKEESIHLRKQLLDEFKKLVKDKENIFLSEVLSGNQGPSFWQLFKTIQWEAKQDQFKGVLLIMDQFEEIFNFPKDQYGNLSLELADLIYNRIPSFFQKTLMEKMEDPIFIQNNKTKIDFIKNELPTSFLIGIRSDRLYLLDELGDMIPIIFNNRFKLQQLLVNEIENIIQEPAIIQKSPKDKDEFLSLPFNYAPDVIKKIKYFFESKEEEGEYTQKPIEAFELQIICQYIEEKVIANFDKEKYTGIEIVVDTSYLPDNIDDVIREYYVNIVKGVNEITKNFTPFELLITRYLIEQKLIDNKTYSRICLDKVSISPIGFTDDLLGKLTKTRIIRRELNTVSGQSYEISHDTLIQPILDASRSSGMDLKKSLSIYYSDAVKRTNQVRFLIRWWGLEKKFLDEHNNLVYLKNEEFKSSKRNNALVNELTKAKILRNEDNNTPKIILNEAFQDVVISKIKKFDFATRKAITLALAVFVIFSIFSVSLMFQIYKLSERERWQRVVTGVSINDTDNYEIKKEKLLAINNVYTRLAPYEFRAKDVSKQLLDEYNKYYFYASFIENNSKDDSISRYDVLNDNEIIILYCKKNAPSIGPVNKGILYDTKLNKIDSFVNIYDAQPFPLINELVILGEDDSLKLYKRHRAIKIKYENADRIIKFKPISFVNNKELYGIATIAGNNRYGNILRNVIIDLDSGKASVLAEYYTPWLYLKNDGKTFLEGQQYNLISIDTNLNKKRVFTRDLPDTNRPVYYSNFDELKKLPGIIMKSNQSDNPGNYYSYQNGYNTSAAIVTDSLDDVLLFRSFDDESKTRRIVIKKMVFSDYDKFGFYITASRDSIRVFNDNLKLKVSMPMPAIEASKKITISSNKAHSKFLLFQSDTSLTVLIAGKATPQIIKTPIEIESAEFWGNNDMIICSGKLKTPASPSVTLIINNNLETIGMVYGVDASSSNIKMIYNNLFIIPYGNKLAIIDPVKTFSKFNNTKPAQVSEWINQHLGKADKAMQKKYDIYSSIIEKF